ncbi:hypothetical protein Tco_0123676 [Tanacetum coccineum]
MLGRSIQQPEEPMNLNSKYLVMEFCCSDWSDQAEEGLTNFALMAYSSISSNFEFKSEPIVIKPIVEKSEAKASKAKPKAARKNNGAPIIED